jgi:microcystin-dependent protein
MAEPFLSEIRLFSFVFAPQGWAQCNGQFLPINQNQALFSLLGTTYGGNGQTTFALPDLRGRTPIHFGNGHTLGERAGETAHTLTMNEMPAHIHLAAATPSAASTAVAAGNLLASTAATDPLYADPVDLAALAPNSITSVGGSQPHENRQPYLTLNFCIALQGIYPSRN